MANRYRRGSSRSSDCDTSAATSSQVSVSSPIHLNVISTSRPLAPRAGEPMALEAVSEQEAGPVQAGPEVGRRDLGLGADVLPAQPVELSLEEGLGQVVGERREALAEDVP